MNRNYERAGARAFAQETGTKGKKAGEEIAKRPGKRPGLDALGGGGEKGERVDEDIGEREGGEKG